MSQAAYGSSQPSPRRWGPRRAASGLAEGRADWLGALLAKRARPCAWSTGSAKSPAGLRSEAVAGWRRFLVVDARGDGDRFALYLRQHRSRSAGTLADRRRLPPERSEMTT